LIDFGSATFEEDYHSSIVSTRHYRAPEIILGLGWSKPCDLWSLGCILVELLTGDALFQTHENLEHLAMMEAVIGPMPDSIIRSATKSGANPSVLELFNLRSRTKRLHWPEGAEGKRSLRAVGKLKSMRSYLESNADPSVHPHLRVIVDLVTKLMAWDPLLRITAEEALAHPFFSTDLSTSA
jgi:dual-specificity kinase